MQDTSVVRDALIVSEVRFLRDSLAEILVRIPRIRVCGQAATLPEALAAARSAQPGILLLDGAFPGGPESAVHLCSVAPNANVIALGVCETEEKVLAWAEAGVCGYVPNTASIDDLVSLIEQITRGEQTCPSRITGSLLRRIAAAGRRLAPPVPLPPLTRREIQILGLVGAGLSNKDISRRLSISLGTTKSHVHNLLGKLSVQRRADLMAHLQSGRRPEGLGGTSS